ncbi:mammalian ependymin-related protein 1-like [Carcharodon carcharias]|uniref:mammalian ependymin-related protein 1-like n=1 Tax=Carcharodon carcharias TaxID=13397 RepID=UPI001B7F6BED|nr:mammalian ependymin-related protein 1-like [Carcharodon carcharias]
MKLLAALSICFLSFLVTVEGNPEPCESPKLLEGQMTTLNMSKGTAVYAKFAYDAIQKRIYALKTTLFEGDEQGQVVDIKLYQESVQYTFYLANRTCVKHPLHVPFKPIRVPDNAKFLSQMYIGSSASPREGLLANVWTEECDSGFCVLTFTEYGCLPLSFLYRSNKDSTLNLESFMSLTYGISDPNVFRPPVECFHPN